MPIRALAMASLLVIAAAGEARSQALGTFRWQLQPYCNLITVTVTQAGATYRLEGTDDRCGSAPSSAIGTAFVNPDGSIGLGFNIVAAPGGQPHAVSARIGLPTLSGTWSDSQLSGAFAFTAGAGTGGSPRPLPVTVGLTPNTILLQADGGFLAAGTFQSGLLPASGAGVRLMWAPAKAAIRAGRVEGTQWDLANIGSESAAFNHNTRASGMTSLAANDGTEASGAASTALGFATRATGASSLAIGEQTLASGAAAFAAGQSSIASGAYSFAAGWSAVASGDSSAAVGAGASASGQGSVALGRSTVATGAGAFTSGDFNVAGGRYSVAMGAAAQSPGARSVALGLRVRASGLGSIVLGSDAVANPAATGSFVFGDRSTTVDIVSFAPNEFVARAAGGVGFYTNAATTSGVEMAAGASSWASLSDARMKENFREVSGEAILAKLAAMPIREWNYTSQRPAIRHLGPTAQDFRAAFGLGESDRYINTLDADGVALAAVKALDDRTRALSDSDARLVHDNESLRMMNSALSRDNAALRQRLERLERLLERK